MSYDYEFLADAWIARAIRYYSKSETALKKYCILAAHVVGKYENGATQAIADGINRSLSTVQNHAHAYRMMEILRNSVVNTRVRTLWRELPASHFWQAWAIHQAGYDAFYYLNNAALHRQSGRDMMDEYKKDLEAGNAPMQFQRGVIALRGILNELLMKHNNRLTEGQRIALLAVLDNFGEQA